ncbi:MAG: hypothetical protein HQL31_09360, partial [Planctomycetes bacterium]|nr:hypothetical protein [Planctomycetota bacterium]
MKYSAKEIVLAVAIALAMLAFVVAPLLFENSSDESSPERIAESGQIGDRPAALKGGKELVPSSDSGSAFRANTANKPVLLPGKSPELALLRPARPGAAAGGSGNTPSAGGEKAPTASSTGREGVSAGGLKRLKSQASALQNQMKEWRERNFPSAGGASSPDGASSTSDSLAEEGTDKGADSPDNAENPEPKADEKDPDAPIPEGNALPSQIFSALVANEAGVGLPGVKLCRFPASFGGEMPGDQELTVQPPET